MPNPERNIKIAEENADSDRSELKEQKKENSRLRQGVIFIVKKQKLKAEKKK